VSASSEPSRGLPADFSVAEKDCALYEGVRYEEYWGDPAQVRQNALEKHLVREMLPPRGHRIIDVGCGYGRLAPCYLDRFDSVVLYDGSMSLLSQARDSMGDRAILVAGDVMRLPFKTASFDNVLSIRVLQHMHDLVGAVGGIRRILAKNGSFLFSYHNKRNAHRVLTYPQSCRIADPFSLESAEVSPTLISHHPERMAALLGDVGFSKPEYRGAVIINSVAKLTERLGGREPSGLSWARISGRYRLAPWLIGRVQALEGPGLVKGEDVSDLFECPACRGDVARRDESFECSECGTRYPIIEGIVDFRL